MGDAATVGMPQRPVGEPAAMSQSGVRAGPSRLASTDADVDAALGTLSERAPAWFGLDPAERVALIDVLLADTLAVAGDWVQACCAAKGIDPASPTAGEEWLAGPNLVIRNLRLLRTTLRDVAEVGRPRLAAAAYERPDGQVAAPVFPANRYDAMLFRGFTAEVWMDPAVTLQGLPQTMAAAYAAPTAGPGVHLVLGAGNVSSIAPMDALYQLFGRRRVVMVKMNPVNAYLVPILAEALRALISPGYLRIVTAGADVGDRLVADDRVAAVHVTGSTETYDAIVYGTGEEGERRRESGRPALTKPVTAELGNVTPVIVVPGEWSRREIAHQAENIASMLTNNAGFNCAAARVLVTRAGWRQRTDLLDAIRRVLAGTPPRVAYYPGARQRFEAFTGAHPESAPPPATGDRLPWVLLDGLDPDAGEEICFRTESFCSVMAEVAIDIPRSAADFVDAAVDFCNDQLCGSLAATIIAQPRSLLDPEVNAAVEQAVADLRYGSVVVNHWAAVAFALVSPTWGAFGGRAPEDMQSGCGVVHNTYLFDRVQKSVVRGPFRSRPTPVWFVGNRHAAQVARRLTAFEADQSPRRLPGLLAHALRG